MQSAAASMMVLVLSEVSPSLTAQLLRLLIAQGFALAIDGAGPAYVPDLEAFELSPSRLRTASGVPDALAWSRTMQCRSF
ncbi:MAG: hypothetical protein F9K35_19980 [Burkholderiaceae bacterium]|nr:MAG: hypothetical protein F9K35_19980 [Burkholderiaceae bacterium]